MRAKSSANAMRLKECSLQKPKPLLACNSVSLFFLHPPPLFNAQFSSPYTDYTSLHRHRFIYTYTHARLSPHLLQYYRHTAPKQITMVKRSNNRSLLAPLLLSLSAATSTLAQYSSSNTACTSHYVVQDGDTCDIIGQKTMTSTAQIMSLNLPYAGPSCYELETGVVSLSSL
jgi:LysM repeat protein